jgi:transposase
MSRGPESATHKEVDMETVHRCCAGLDVHKKTIAACVRRSDHQGRLHEDIRTFGTMTSDLLALADWMSAQGVTHVAMESTGVFWKPVFNILEGSFELLLVNARHIKQVPGRKTDVKDCQWIAQLLQHGLLRASYVPQRPQQELRDLTRHRAQLVGEHTRVANRIHKTLEDANIKLAAVASDILGVSGRQMIEALIRGQEDPAKLADLARRKLRAKIPQLQEALHGRVTEHHRFMLRTLMGHLQYLESTIQHFNTRIEELTLPFADQIQHLSQVPGLERRSIENVLAEIGTDMDRFPTHAQLASWAGMCSGNRESAGKRSSGRTTPGNRWLRSTLAQAAWAASHKKDSYFQAQYRRLAGRRGKKRAAVAVGHSLLVVIYHMLKDGRDYQELGADYLDRLDPARVTRYHVKRLERLGYEVTLTPQKSAA